MDNNFDEPIKEQEPSQPQKEDNKTWYFFLFLLFIWAGNYIYNLFTSKEKRKRTRTPDKMQKEDVCKMYQVDKQTLGKWVKYFCNPSVLSYETYKKRRRLMGEEYLHFV